MTPLLRTYLLAPAAAAGAIVLLMLGLAPTSAGDPVLMVLLVVLGAIAANFPVMVSPRYKTDAAPAIDLALVLLFPPATAVALVGLSRILGDGLLWLRRNPATGKRRRRLIDLVFNTSQLMIAAAAAAIVYHGLASAGELGGGLIGQLASAGLAACVMYTLSISMVVIAAGLMTGRSPFQIWVEAAGAELKQTAAIYIAGYLLAVVSNGRPWLAVVMMGPVAGLQLALNRSVQLREQTVSAVESMADVVDHRDPYTFQHSQSVAAHVVATARKLGLPDREVELIRLAARVHDLGKIAVPDEVLHKQGRLTDAEFALMKKHPETGAEILAKFPQYKLGRALVLAHHERMDGRGYPRGLSGSAIPLGARIIAVADAWDAMTSDRPYRTALDPEVALGELLRGRGTQWDAEVVDAFALTLPGAVSLEPERRADVGRPLLRSLGAVAGLLTS
ncbi:MAG TPA: HD-GYP domain-containing protein [Candidatus Eisenbacteria bacterium]|nr:HD-GYP domain-containing protein [Candidatus Eisenbacteria bacterium]